MVSQYFFGNRAGCIGETSILLILISFAFLVLTKIIDWRAPLAMTATVAAGTFCLHLQVQEMPLPPEWKHLRPCLPEDFSSGQHSW